MIRRTAKIAAAVFGGLLLLVVVLLAAVVGGSATRPGQAAIERLVPPLTGGMVHASGLSGWLFGASRVARVEVADAQGTWLTIDDLSLDWSPLRLFAGEVMVHRIAADRVEAVRRPVSSGSSSTITLPLRVDIAALHIGQVGLAPPVIGLGDDQAAIQPAAPQSDQPARPQARPRSSQPAGQTIWLTVDGAGRLDSGDQGAVQLNVRRLNEAGTYAVNARLDPAGIHATLHLAEPAGGLIASLAALPAMGAIAADATLSGPLDAIATEVTLGAGALRAHLAGQVDAVGESGDLNVTAEAPAMAPRPDLSWRGIALQGRVHGPVTKPDASATLVVEGLLLGQGGTGPAAAGSVGQGGTAQPSTGQGASAGQDVNAGQAEIGRITAKLQGNAGQLTLDGTVDGIRLPGPKPETLAAAPVQVTAAWRLDTADRRLTFSLHHPLFSIDGTAATAGEQRGELHLIVPEIAPLAAADGIDVAGSAALTFSADRKGEDTRVGARGTFDVTAIPGDIARRPGVVAKAPGDATKAPGDVTHEAAPASPLLGQDMNVDAFATLHGQTVRVARLNIDSNAFSVGLSGTVAPGALDVDWRVTVADLAKVSPSVTGPIEARGKVSGSADNLGVTAALTGTVGAGGITPGTVSAQVALTGLPNAPAGRVAAHGMLLGAPLELAITAAQQNGGIRVAIEQANWKSAHAEGTLLVNLAALRNGTDAVRNATVA